jgi:hypothetical protein
MTPPKSPAKAPKEVDLTGWWCEGQTSITDFLDPDPEDSEEDADARQRTDAPADRL